MRRTIAACLVLSPALLCQEPEKVVSGQLGFDVTSQYFFRGLLQENQGIIFQPRVELGYGLYDAEGDDGTLRSLDLRFGLWNSLHDGPTGGAGGIWYESDFYVEVAGKLGERFGAPAGYWVYSTPNGTASFSKGAAPVEELVFRVDYDDRGMWFDSIESGLRPWAVLAIEVDGQRDVPSGGHVGTYLELGVEPSFVIGKLGDGDLTLSFPSKIGLSLGDYYERPQANGGNDDFFGYLDVGAEVYAPLTFLPARMGPWDGYAALHLLLLGDNNEARNGGDVSEFVFSFGMSTTF